MVKKLDNYFKFKDSIDDFLMSSLVYKYNRNRYNYIYVGKTTRHIAIGISEYIGVSYRTSTALSGIREDTNDPNIYLKFKT